LPAPSVEAVSRDKKKIKSEKGLTYLRFEKGMMVCELQAGTYLFNVKR
jgi:hypothetical protein